MRPSCGGGGGLAGSSRRKTAAADPSQARGLRQAARVLRQTVSASRDDLDAANADRLIAEKEVARLAAELGRTQETCKKAENTVVTRHEAYKNLQAGWAALLEAHKEDIELLEGKVRTLCQQKEGASKELQSAKLAQMNAKLAQLNAEVDKAKVEERLAGTQKELAEYKHTVEIHSTHITKMNKESKQVAAAHKTEMAIANRELTLLKAQKVQATKDRSKLRERAEAKAAHDAIEFETKIAIEQAEKDTSRATAKAWRGKCERARADLKNEREFAAGAKAAARRLYSSLQSANGSKSVEITALRRRNYYLRLQVESTKKARGEANGHGATL